MRKFVSAVVALLILTQLRALAQVTQPLDGTAFREVVITLTKPYQTAVQNISSNEIIRDLENSRVPHSNGVAGADGAIIYANQLGTIKLLSDSVDGVMRWRIWVSDAQGNPSTLTNQALADEVVDSLKRVLADHAESQRDQYQSRLSWLQGQFNDGDGQRGSISAKLSLLRSITQSAELADSSVESVRSMAHELDLQLESTTVDIAGKTARQKALADAISKLSGQLDAQVSNDPIVVQLKVVAVRKEDILKQVRQAAAVATASSADVDRAVADLAQAQAAVLERKESVAKAAGGDSLDQWNQELLSLSVDLAEQSARRDVIKDRLDTLSKVLHAIVNQPSEESLQKKLDDLDEQIRQLGSSIQEVNSRLAKENEPQLSVVQSPNGSGVK